MDKYMQYPLATLEQAARFFVEDNRHCPCVARLWERRAEYNPVWEWSTFRRKIERGETQREIRADMKYLRQKQIARKIHGLCAHAEQPSESRLRSSENRVLAFLASLPGNEALVAGWLLCGMRLSRLAGRLGVSRATLSKRSRRIAAALRIAFPEPSRRMLRKQTAFCPARYVLQESFVKDGTLVRVYKA